MSQKNVLLNLIDHQRDINKIFLCFENPNEQKYEYLIKKPQEVGQNILKIQRSSLNTRVLSRMSAKVLKYEI